MSPPPDSDTEEGTVFMPNGFQRSVRSPSGAAAPASRLARAAAASEPVGNPLPVGTHIGEFQITRLIGEGGFGIVYEAHDGSLDRRVALKEYMPSELAERGEGRQVRCVDEDDEEVFRKGLQSFINEARILARFDHPSLLKVYRFWEDNGTAYMAMPYYEGPTLLEALRRLHRPPEEAWLMGLLEPLTSALAVIHEQQIYHRDISPDNILLLAGTGRPLLLDFGAARRVINDANQKDRAPTAIVKPGYAPVEQYSDIVMKQGPWSDVYALAAVLHFAITGKKPPAAISRLAGDAYVPLSTVAAGRYSPALLSAIDKALIVRPEERTRDIDAFRAALGLPPLPRDALGMLLSSGSTPASDEVVSGTPPELPITTRSRIFRAPVVPTRSLLQSVQQRVGPGRAPVALGAVALTALLMLGGLAWWAWPDAPEVPVAGAPAGPAAPAAGPAESAPTGAPPVAPEPAVLPVAGPLNVVDEFARIQSLSTPGHSVTVLWRSKPSFRIKAGDVLAMNVTSMQDGYLYVLGYTPDNVLFQYYPNALVQDNFVRRQTVIRIPGELRDPQTGKVHEGIALTDPPGKGHLLVIVSRHPRDFGLLGQRREDIYPVYPTGEPAQALRAQHPALKSIYLGEVRCPVPGCEDQFGAVTDAFDILP
jgi:serine/threonine protein kinase